MLRETYTHKSNAPQHPFGNQKRYTRTNGCFANYRANHARHPANLA